MNLRNIMLSALFTPVVIFSASCSKKDDDTPKPAASLKIVMVNNLPADPVGHDPNTGAPVGGTNQYTFFRFKDSTIVPNSDSASAQWDIGFRGTDIILNGGVSGPGNTTGQVVKNTFNDVTEAPGDGYRSDDASGHVFADWFNYNTTTHIVTPVPGDILIIHTTSGRYVKMEILSYYQNAPASPTLNDEARYYTFHYIIQTNGGKEFESTK